MKRLCLLAMIGLLGFLTGCDNNKPPQTTTVKISKPQATNTAKDRKLGDGIRIKFITADGDHDQMQWSIQRQMEVFINSGKYEIVQVSTTRCNDGHAHLISAEVYYRPKK